MVHDTIHSPDNWAETAAEIIATHLRQGLEITSRASLVVPGGRTAGLVLPLLAQQNVTWEHVDIILSDERWVDAEHPDSNERLVQKILSNSGTRLATFTGLKTAAAHPTQALDEIESRLRPITRPFSVTFLGMGEDGHVASIFPHVACLTPPLSVLAVDRTDHPRISLTPAALLDSRIIVLVAPGKNKRDTLEKASTSGSPRDYPVRYILHQNHTRVFIVTG